LHHTLLAGRTRTGVTLQTLHPKKFDQGVILNQTPYPGFEIPNPEVCTVPELLEIVAPKGAEMLVNGIRNRIFLPPFQDAGCLAAVGDHKLNHAIKITSEDRHLDWPTWTWAQISRRNRVLGPLWNKTLVADKSLNGKPSFESKRVIFTRIENVEPLPGSERLALIPGVPFVDSPRPLQTREKSGLYVFTRDNQLIRIYRMKIEGDKESDGVQAALKAQMLSDRIVRSGSSEFTVSYNPLH
jgi:methionyl-tRNA formyltransferase